MSKLLNPAKPGRLSTFDPRRKGTDEATLLKQLRPDLLEAKAHPSPRRRLAGRLTYLRQALGLSQAVLAKKAGIGVATYQRIEQCQPNANPGLDVLEKLAKALKIEFDGLWKGPMA
jgi:DNA-binding XRE family transcriptional regulator